jgi:hypothetical protein
MEEISFEQAVVEALRDVPARQRATILRVVRTLAQELKEPERTDGHRRYNVEQHRAVRALTAAVRGSLAAAVSAERDERG